MKNSLTGVFTPASDVESVKFQKLAVALGYAWGKAGAKVIGLGEGKSIKLTSDGRMAPVSNAESASLTVADLQTALIESRKGQVVTTRAALLSVFNKTKCREIEDGIKALLQDNFDKDDNEEFVVPQELLDRAAKELDDDQRAYFKAAGIVITHPNDKYTVQGAVGTEVPTNLRGVEVQEIGVSAKLGSVLMDAEGNVYFAK